MKLIGSIISAWVLGASSLASAAIITEYEFTGDTLAPTTVSPNVTATVMTTVSTTSGTGSGFITETGTPSGSPQFSRTGFANGGYFSFTVQADSGFALDLTNFEFYQRLGSTGTDRTFSIEYIIQGESPVAFSPLSASTTIYTLRSQALSITGETRPIEFRINGSLLGADTTTFRIDDVKLEGVVVPEPNTIVLAAFGMAACVCFVCVNRQKTASPGAIPTALRGLAQRS